MFSLPLEDSEDWSSASILTNLTPSTFNISCENSGQRHSPLVNPFRGEEYSPGCPAPSARKAGNWTNRYSRNGQLEKHGVLQAASHVGSYRKHYTPSVVTIFWCQVAEHISTGLNSPIPIVNGRVITWREQTHHHHDQVNQFLWCLLHLVSLPAYTCIQKVWFLDLYDSLCIGFAGLKDFLSLLTCLIPWTFAMATSYYRVRWSFKGHSVPQLLKI